MLIKLKKKQKQKPKNKVVRVITNTKKMVLFIICLASHTKKLILKNLVKKKI